MAIEGAVTDAAEGNEDNEALAQRMSMMMEAMPEAAAIKKRQQQR